MAGLTAKNKQAIDLYLGADPDCKGNGTRSWQKVYGTKKAETASAAWARMLGNVKAQEYMGNRLREVQEEVKKKIAYGVEEAVATILAVQEDAMVKCTEEDEDGNILDLGMRDRKTALQSASDALKVQGLYINKSEGVSVQATPEDRQHAALLGMGLTEFLDHKAAGTLPDPPEIPETRTRH